MWKLSWCLDAVFIPTFYSLMQKGTLKATQREMWPLAQPQNLYLQSVLPAKYLKAMEAQSLWEYLINVCFDLRPLHEKESIPKTVSIAKNQRLDSPDIWGETNWLKKSIK